MKTETTTKTAQLVKTIQAHTKESQENIARAIGYSPSQLNQAINGKIPGEKIYARLQAKYPQFADTPTVNNDFIAQKNLAYSKVILGAVGELLAITRNLPAGLVLQQLNEQVLAETKSLDSLQ